MPDYDFHTLSPVDFEELTRDLLQASHSIVFQSFKVGRDRGVDLRYAGGGENRIVQCKHYRKSGYNALLRELRKEAVKIARMDPKPDRYLLSTSVELSDANKQELVNILGISKTEDIFGGNDLNNLLGLHPEVEKRHYKLWLASAEILQRVLHNAETMQTDFECRRIAREIPRFVQTQAYTEAAEKLKQDRVLVLSGLPGVGKTTIANFLVYEKFAEGYQPVIARNGFEEARTLYREGIRQIFFYDDFLGATFLGEGGSVFARNEDRAITDFLNVIADDKDKLLILTTREHIFSDALQASERLRHSSIRDFRHVVRVGVYTPKQRAEILYNHAYFNNLGGDYLNQILAKDFFFQVIKHPKFSPRIIEWLTTPRRVKGPASEYQAFAIRLLNDPTEVWLHAYQNQISHAGRSALLALHSLNGRVNADRLAEAFARLHATRAAQYGFTTAPDDFLRAMRVLSGAFISIGNDAVDFIDPSVRDLMNSILCGAPANCLDVLRSAVSMIQVSAIWSLAKTRDGAHIRSQLDAALQNLIEGFRSALEADLFVYGDRFIGTYTPAIETRLALLAEISGKLDNRALDVLIAPTIERTIQVWRSQRPNVSAAIRAIELLGQYALEPQPEFQALQRKLISALAIHSETDLEPNEMVWLLKLVDEWGWSAEEREALSKIAIRWSDIAERLRACDSEYELERLAKQMRQVASVLNVDLRAPIQKVEVELRMFVPADEPQPAAQEYQSPREYEFEAARVSIRALFATLSSAIEPDSGKPPFAPVDLDMAEWLEGRSGNEDS